MPVAFRSPIDVAILPGGNYALTANHTSDSVSLIDLVSGKVLAEQACGHKPSAVACARDGVRVAVSNLWSGTISFLEQREASLKPAGQVAVGPLPRGLAFTPDSKSLYVAVAGADEIACVDYASRKITWRTPAPREPPQTAAGWQPQLRARGRCVAGTQATTN